MIFVLLGSRNSSGGMVGRINLTFFDRLVPGQLAHQSEYQAQEEFDES
jgi:hypothetical protein